MRALSVLFSTLNINQCAAQLSIMHFCFATPGGVEIKASLKLFMVLRTKIFLLKYFLAL